MLRKLRFPTALIVLTLAGLACASVQVEWFATPSVEQNQAGTSMPASESNSSSSPSNPINPLQDIDKFGAASIPLKITVPEGMRVVEKAAFVARQKDEPELFELYVAILLENPKATIHLIQAYKLWTYDTEKLGDSLDWETQGGPTGAVIPANQKGVIFWKSGGSSVSSIPSRMEITFSLTESPKYQKSLDKLNDTTLPNPYFTAVSSEIVANQQPGGNLYDIEANGKYINNLPVKCTAAGFFLFYDDKGNIVGFADTRWPQKMSYLALPNGQGELTASLPYRVAVKPAKVVFYPYTDFSGMVTLQNIK